MQIARDFDALPRLIHYVQGCSEEELRADLSVFIIDRDLESLGRIVGMVRDLKPNQLEAFGATNAEIAKKLDMIIEKIGDYMPRIWRSIKRRTYARSRS